MLLDCRRRFGFGDCFYRGFGGGIEVRFKLWLGFGAGLNFRLKLGVRLDFWFRLRPRFFFRVSFGRVFKIGSSIKCIDWVLDLRGIYLIARSYLSCGFSFNGGFLNSGRLVGMVNLKSCSKTGDFG